MGENTSEFPLLARLAEIPYLLIRVMREIRAAFPENILPGLCFLCPPILSSMGCVPIFAPPRFPCYKGGLPAGNVFLLTARRHVYIYVFVRKGRSFSIFLFHGEAPSLSIP